MRCNVTSGLCAMFAVLAPGMALADIPVATPQDLVTAIAQAPADETLILAPGDYGVLAVTQATRADRPLTLRSADPAHPARFSAFALNAAANLTLDGLSFDYRFQKGDPLWTAPFTIYASHNLTIRNSTFDGDLARGVSKIDDGYGAGIGLTVDKSDAITLSGNRFSTFLRGLAVTDSDHVTVIGNEITAIRSDGMDFAAVQSLLVAENSLHDFKAAPLSEDHADMIQFWTAGTTRPSTDIVIRDNVLNSGNGDLTQSIFMGNELVRQGLAGKELYYRNVTISGNVIVNSHLHGITVGESLGLTISHNTLIHNHRTDGAENNPPLWTPSINISEVSQQVTVEGNATPRINGAETRPDWTLRDNVFIQDTDPAAPDYYDQVFVAALTGNPATLAPFAYLVGGPLDGVKAGASRLVAAPAKAGAAVIHATRDRRFVNLFAFDASQSAASAGTRYLWDFGDGTGAEGQGVTHVFASPGEFTATLTLVPASGPKVRDTALLTVPSPDILRFDPAKGQLLVSDAKEALSDIPTTRSPDGKGRVLPLGQGQPPIAIPHDHLKSLFGAMDFEIALDLRLAQTADPSGEILRLHNSMTLAWKPSSGLSFRLETAKIRPVTISTGPLPLDPASWHQVTIRYDAASGQIALTVDGAQRAKGKSAGPIKPDALQDLTLGNPFGEKTLDGYLRALEIRTNLTAYAAAP